MAIIGIEYENNLWFLIKGGNKKGHIHNNSKIKKN